MESGGGGRLRRVEAPVNCRLRALACGGRLLDAFHKRVNVAFGPRGYPSELHRRRIQSSSDALYQVDRLTGIRPPGPMISGRRRNFFGFSGVMAASCSNEAFQ